MRRLAARRVGSFLDFRSASPIEKISCPPSSTTTIVYASDRTKSARFLTEILGRPAPVRFGPFEVVDLDNGVSLDFAATEGPIEPQHYAFLIGEADFDAVLKRIREQGVEYWADPWHRRPNEINRNDGGRGVYFPDPDGHYLEVMTRPYGSA